MIPPLIVFQWDFVFRQATYAYGEQVTVPEGGGILVTISLCMIVKNEEHSLPRCLRSVHEYVDEIIIVDTGSSDKTKAIASTFTEKVFDFKWVDDFSAARNFSFSKATQDFILWLDADDVILEGDQEKLAKLKRELNTGWDSVQLPYVLSRQTDGTPSQTVIRNRLVKRENLFLWKGAVHEYLEVSGNIIQSDACITHMGDGGGSSDRNISIYENMIKENKTFTPRDLYYYANECFDHRNFGKAIEYYKKFLSTELGWTEDVISSCGKLADCYISLNEFDTATDYILQSFKHDLPRGEQCCKLGYIYILQKDYEKAVFWYDLSTSLDYEKDKSKGGFINKGYYTWVPHLQLCVCFDQLEDYHAAKHHNEMARKYAPEHPSVLHNESYLKSILG